MDDGASSTSIGMRELIAYSIKKKIEISAPHSRTEACCIYRVPEKYHKLSSAYRPEGISIGPYHRSNQRAKGTQDPKDKALEATEEDLKNPSFNTTHDLKLLYAHKVLTLTTTTDEQTIKAEEPKATRTIKLDSMGTLVTSKGWFAVLEDCVSSIEKMETKIRECYSEPVSLNSKEFVEMMVIDGLFIVGFLLVRFSLKKEEIVDDLLYNNHWLSIAVENDILLLENQLPFFVLQSLFDIVSPAAGPGTTAEGLSLEMLVVKFFDSSYLYMLPNTCFDTYLDQCAQAKHLLDFLFILLQPPISSEELIDEHSSSSSISPCYVIRILKKYFNESVIAKFTCSPLKSFTQTVMKSKIIESLHSRRKQKETLLDSVVEFIPSATELCRSGIKFKKGSTKRSFMEVKFNNGIMEIPPISIYDGTDTLLRNLIACEQLYNGHAYISSYALLMYSLIDSTEDVEVLRQQKIITNYLGCDQDVCNIFNNLGFEVSLVCGYHYEQQSNAANIYYKKSWHKWRATLWREYFHNPWSTISFFAAVLLIVLTVLSTIFGILSFAVPKT
ncbi:hypothetical protein MKW94_028256 [Papaver nudicaule]|uniref:Uncharacterized protein n=1 Tax=Papaver nudicaule TaxID=74823 RepID=A0AA41VTH2_PAPNU|nr:hypothetical protein [Papaver nudicaule]